MIVLVDWTGKSRHGWSQLVNAGDMNLLTSKSWSAGRRHSNSSASKSSTVLGPTSPGNNDVD